MVLNGIEFYKLYTYFAKMKWHYLFFSLLFFSLVSCKKDNLVTDDAPVIEFVSISPSEVTEYDDMIVIVISYADANGDLGENDPDIKNLFVTDSRNEVMYQYRIQQLAPDDTEIYIQGNLNIEIKNTALVDENASSETLTYSVYVRDRAGNDSNTITTSSITVKK
jgi:hypothetical protein